MNRGILFPSNKRGEPRHLGTEADYPYSNPARPFANRECRVWTSEAWNVRSGFDQGRVLHRAKRNTTDGTAHRHFGRWNGGRFGIPKHPLE